MKHIPTLIFAAALLSSCQTHPTSFLDAVTPESVSVGLTAPNLIAGPIQSSKSRLEDRRDSTGVIGVSVSVTYRLKPIKVERADPAAPQPVAVVSPTPPLLVKPAQKP